MIIARNPSAYQAINPNFLQSPFINGGRTATGGAVTQPMQS